VPLVPDSGLLRPATRGMRCAMIRRSLETRAVALSPVRHSPNDAVPPGLPPPVVVSPAEQARLLGIARAAVAVAAGARPRDALQAALDEGPLPELRAAAFVTLTEHGELRGCMGTLEADGPAWASVVDAAGWATRGDPRFPGVRPDELGAIEIDVSILGPLVPCDDPLALRPGTDGVVIARGGRRGLLLPEVADMVGGGAAGMLDACCRKAGLRPGAWRDHGTKVRLFRTHRFGGPAA
jgi:AmmeMemoRadiSam system protein A